MPCPDGCIGWTEPQLDAQMQWSWHIARTSAAEEIAGQFRTESGDLFAKNLDEQAQIKREYADWIEAWAKKERELESRAKKEYEAEYESS